MIDKQFEWNIDGIQANTVLPGAEVSIPIDKSNYEEIFSNRIVAVLKEIDKNIGYYFDGDYKNLIMSEIHLSYFIKDDKYHIGFNYNEILNNILTKLGMNNTVKTIKLDSDLAIKKISLEVDREISFQKYVINLGKSEPWDKSKEQAINNLSKIINILVRYLVNAENVINEGINKQIEEEKILRDKKKSLLNVKNKYVSWKNLMFYTSCKALNIFDKTNDNRYYKYAKNYYLCVSRDKKVEYPLSMKVDGEFMDYQYNSFNSKFLKMQRKYFSSLDVRLGIDDLDTIDGSLLEGRKVTGNKNESKSKKRKIDYSKIDKKTERKISFYKGLRGKVTGIIKEPLSSDLNYIGFVLDNNYVIYEKFYEVSKKNNTIIPAFDNAIYVVSLDVACECHFDKSEIRKYIKKHHNYKAFRLYHNDNDSYQKRINEVLDYSDVSLIKFKELKLLNEKRD